ncbi:hypothetical protein EFP52_16645, partial [Lacticaseibacillus paracasei]|nr:hypothetical protein [Lacticaseibacillus paracasei]
SLDGMLCKHHFSKNGQVFFHIFWVVTLIMQSRMRYNYFMSCLRSGILVRTISRNRKSSG